MPTYTTRTAALVAVVHQQTVIRWAEDGLVVPSVKRNKYEPRQYTLQDLVAVSVVRTAQKFGIPEHKVLEMVKVAQSPDEKQQKNAAIVAARASGWMQKGFVCHYFYSNVKDPDQAASLRHVKEEGLVLQQVSFYDILQGIRNDIQEKILDNKEILGGDLGQDARWRVERETE